MSSNPKPIADPNQLLSTYSFLPWLRRGIATTITAAPGGARATVDVALNINGTPVSGGGGPIVQPVSQQIELYGPGDLLGFESRAVVRTEPGNKITLNNFEANYLPGIDFYDEDFPWRYSPQPPTGTRLQPWIALIVLADGEFKEGQNLLGRPLPFISLNDVSVLPNAADLWAWAHVHFNESLSPDATKELVSTDMNAVLGRVAAIGDGNPDLVYSRLLSSRRLKENTAYHAFVIPTYESGRLAGLGFDPSKTPSTTALAWPAGAGQPEPLNFPYYFRWEFRTGDRGDFQYLVSLLKPQPVDSTVGTRTVDVTDPGSNIPPIAKPELGGVLRLGGALQVPDGDLSDEERAARDTFENWDQPYPDDFQVKLAEFINLPDDYAAKTAADANAATSLGPGVDDDPDPLITSPLYGRWHSLTQRLLTNRDGSPAPNTGNWVHRLNLDPRFRVSANYGVEVVEANAEEYMNDAWEQIGDVLAANQKIRRLHFALYASLRLYDRHVLTQAGMPQRVLSLTAPVSKRVLMNGSTVASLRATTLIPSVLTSTAMRRVLRPGARLMRTLPVTATANRTNLLERINAGKVTSAPPKTVPAGVPTVDKAAGAVTPSNIPPWLADWLKRFPWLPFAVLVIAIVLALILLFIAAPLAVIVLAVGIYLFRLLRKWQTAAASAGAVSEAGQTVQSISQMPSSSNFVLSQPGASFTPALGGPDNATAVRFKTALADSFTVIAAGNQVGFRPAPVPLNLTLVSTNMVSAIHPQATILKRGLTTIFLPPWLIGQIGEDFNEVMAYPKLDLPMYKPLSDYSSDRFVPNINKIPENSITLMETNQRFIESYMVGLNHDFAAKLLWREYPTDQRGSYFRQFWAVDNVLDTAGRSHSDMQDDLYDIPELHKWPLSSALGDHNKRADPANPGAAQAVLIVRGELLKKYPNTVIFAQHAKRANGVREPDWLTPQEELDPPRDKTRSPLFHANPVSDIYLFGFDLTIDQIKGDQNEPGWYFVLQERPGEPRFGLELTHSGAAETFDDLTWDKVAPAVPAGGFLPLGAFANVALTKPGVKEDPNKLAQFNDDEKVNPADVSSARWAYLLFRQPVIVAIHGDEMLRKNRA